MVRHHTKYIIAATLLSYLVLTEALIVEESSLVNPLDSLASKGYAIQVPSEEDEKSSGNSPQMDEELKESEESKESEMSEESEDTEDAAEEETVRVNNVIDENMFAAAGIAFRQGIDLPVLRQRVGLPDQDVPPVPQVIACRTDGQVALTYSEGPSDATARIARQLNEAQTRGNFFVNTKWLNQQQYIMVLQNIYNAGHFIGMTYRLPNEDPEAMSDEEIKADIIQNARMIETLIDVSPKYVRLHFSAQNDGRAEQILKELGFILVGYNLDAKDYAHEQPESIAEEYSKTFKTYRDAHGAKGSFVAIQYDIPETKSMAAVPHILQLLQKEGYDAVRMDGCLNDATPYKKSADGLQFVGDKFSFGTAGYNSGQKVAISIISNHTAEEEMRGLSADDSFLTSSATKLKIGLAALIPALLFTLLYEK